MNRINNNKPNNIAFSANNRGNSKMLSKEEQMNILIPKGSKIITTRAEREVPENGKFRTVAVTFDIPETQNEAVISIEADSKDFKDQRRVSIGVRRQHSDKLTFNYMFKGTKKEVIDYLADNKNFTEFITSINSLSEAVDEDYSTM